MSRPWQEARRLAALAQTGLLDSPPEPRFDAIVLAAQHICEAPISIIGLVDADRQWFKAKVGIDISETSLDTSCCAMAIGQNDLFVINDLAADPRTCNFSLVTQPPYARFYAGFPIVTDQGAALGSLCVVDTKPRPEGLSLPQAVALEALAKLVAQEIDNRTLQRGRFGGEPPHSVGMWDWDVPNDRVVADPGFARLYGVDARSATEGAPIAAFFRGIHPDDRPRVQAEVTESLSSGKPLATEYRLTGPDGHARWVMAQGRPVLDAKGRAIRFPGMSFDIHSRKEAELRMAALVALSDRLNAPGDPSDLAFAGMEILGTTLQATRAGYGLVDLAGETIVIEQIWMAPEMPAFPRSFGFRDFGAFIDDLMQNAPLVVEEIHTDRRTGWTAATLEALEMRSLVNLPIIEDGRLQAVLFVNDHTPRAWSDAELRFIRDVAERTRSAVERRRAEQKLATLTAALERQIAAHTAELVIARDDLRQAQTIPPIRD